MRKHVNPPSEPIDRFQVVATVIVSLLGTLMVTTTTGNAIKISNQEEVFFSEERLTKPGGST